MHKICSALLRTHCLCLCFQIPASEFSKVPNVKQYVYLQAQFPDRLLEKVVLVSFQSGYIVIQTDKTIYTPNSQGKFNATLVLKKTHSSVWGCFCISKEKYNHKN